MAQQKSQARTSATNAERPANTPAARVAARDHLVASQATFVDDLINTPDDDPPSARDSLPPAASSVPSISSVPNAVNLEHHEGTVQALIEEDDDEIELRVSRDTATLGVINFLAKESGAPDVGNLCPLQWAATLDQQAPASQPPPAVFDDEARFFDAEPYPPNEGPSRQDPSDDSGEPDVIPVPLVDVKKRLSTYILIPVEKSKSMAQMYKVWIGSIPSLPHACSLLTRMTVIHGSVTLAALGPINLTWQQRNMPRGRRLSYTCTSLRRFHPTFVHQSSSGLFIRLGTS